MKDLVIVYVKIKFRYDLFWGNFTLIKLINLQSQSQKLSFPKTTQ